MSPSALCPKDFLLSKADGVAEIALLRLCPTNGLQRASGTDVEVETNEKSGGSSRFHLDPLTLWTGEVGRSALGILFDFIIGQR